MDDACSVKRKASAQYDCVIGAATDNKDANTRNGNNTATNSRAINMPEHMRIIQYEELRRILLQN